MGWQYTVFALPTLFAMITAVLLGAYSLQYMRVHGRSSDLVAFFAVNVGLVLWTGFSALKLLQTDPSLKLLFYRLLYFGVAPLGALALLFTLLHTDRVRRITPGLVGALTAIPVVFLALLFTNPNGLAIEATRLVETNGLVVLRVDVGLGHVVLQLLYNAVLCALAVALILYEAVRLGRSYIPQAVLVSVGLVAPFVFVACATLGIPPFSSDGVNLVPTSAAVTSAAIGVALFRYRFLDLPPIAYTTAMEESPDGVFVLDADERIVHVNDRGARLLERFDAAVGDPVTRVSPDLDLTTESNDSVRTTREDGEAVYLSARSQRLERGDETIGWVIVLRDVTELHRQKQTILSQNEKLTLLNQIVRHDIRNDMAVILGNAQLVEESVDDEVVRERLETIIRNGEHATELTENVRNLMATMLDDEETNRPTTLAGPLRAEASAVRDGTPEAAVSLPDEPSGVTVVADDMLGTVFRNLLTNAVRHNDADRAEIDVSVEVRDDDALVRIADNGPGIPDERKEEVFGRGEKGLESPGTGLGLYLVDTIVSGYGGDVWVEDNEPRGAVFVVRLQRA
ncbi:histidine kinase N-terminal 7TM domain-containing protein [Haloferax marisrubri]|uniref:histidine kinase n=1 Tax=Haloferax marisrubri TaxID=1544719 RepID=A0A2P4NMG5_9EURY|nr:histidine kinase N-terminal 7TM domain-containing protein [Haloferax marisrubri]POG54352.1 PAS domain-containing sensor histidine kinase [Haloferax marisrubri]